jgi:hypothetical protein
MKRVERLKSLERLFNGDFSAIDKLNSITVTKVVKHVSGVITVELLDRPMQVSFLNSDDWLDCIGIIYLKGGGYFLKSFIGELNKYEVKYQSDILELPLFLD